MERDYKHYYYIIRGEITVKEFDDALSLVSEKYNVGALGDINFISRMSNILWFIFRKSTFCVVKLLYDKGIDIFKEVKCRDFPMKFWGELESGDYLWGENSNDVLNRPEVDKAIVSYIHHKNRFDLYFLK